MNAKVYNARDLTIKWIKQKKPKEVNFPKFCGIFQNLLKKYNSDEISNAMLKYIFYYEYGKIEGFSTYCKRIIINERRKR